MPKLKLLFFLAVWQRPEITEICFMGLNRLMESDKLDVQALAVISEESMIPLCENYNISHCFHENLPLGKKKNFGLSIAKGYDFDYLVEIGSDDLLKDEFLDLYPFDKQVMGLHDFVMIDTETGSARRLKSRDASYGLGRAFRLEVLEAMNFKLWNDNLNMGLDNNSEFRLAAKGYKVYRYSCDEPVAIDLKSEVNIWPFNESMGVPYPIEEAFEGLTVKEVNAIKCLNRNRVLA